MLPETAHNVNVSPSAKLSADLHVFFIRNTFIRNARPKLAKNQANAKQQHSKTELLPLEIYSHSSSTLSFENNRTYSKK